MIVEGLVSVFFMIVKLALNFLPTVVLGADWFVDVVALIVKASQFFPMDVFVAVMANIIFWVGVHFNWSVAMWILKKIPGIN